MRKIATSAKHAFFLLRQLGVRRFAIVLIFWMLRRHRRLIGPVFSLFGSKAETISRDPVLVYQMSKVGSTSLLYSLQFAYVKAGLPNVMLHHAHTLTNLDLHEQLITNANGPAQAIALVHEYKLIRRAFEAKADEHWNVISVVRDPVARQISDFFHHIDRNLPDWQRRWEDRSLTIDQVMQSFLAAEDPTRNWFEGEGISVLGIDVYASPFPHETGFAIYSRPPKVDMAVIRLEDMDRVASQAIQRLLGIKNFKLHSFNLGSETGYSEIYRQFKTKPLPGWYLEKAYSERMARHFYTRAELEGFAKKWSHEAV